MSTVVCSTPPALRLHSQITLHAERLARGGAVGGAVASVRINASSALREELEGTGRELGVSVHNLALYAF